ncbi:hypothetical protein QQS21_008892 [Conoideocrella luteorostrata]|uniref:RTA1 like protein n=1 Tax=Conoideocrella luteorostrata TaxID=1105319 RepID=A0AAJ0CKN5_9HYPO|nr:hypothetical protein QQS21_008892 [Conoideocrella luteorostrata]
MAQLKLYNGHYYLWDYVPSTVAAVIFIILFIAATLFITWRMVRTRTYFSIPFVIGGVFQFLGYIGRALAHDQTDQLGPYVMQSILILVAPALFAASIYMTLGRLMRSIHGERHSLIPIGWLTKAFVLCDVFSFMIQASGGGLMAKKDFSPKTAQNIILAGLFVQIIAFGVFVVTAVVFQVRMRKWPSRVSANSSWKGLMAMLYATSALIMVRSVFRIIEYVMGKEGYLLTHEWTLYVFDAALMFSAMVVYGWRYPALGAVVKPRAWEDVDEEAAAAAVGLGARN